MSHNSPTPESRRFAARGSITIEYSMGFSEADAREWFPDAHWDDPEASQAGMIEELAETGQAPVAFWAALIATRRRAIDDETALNGDGRPFEALNVGEL